MSHLQHVRAHVIYLRVCARSLQQGDEQARAEALRLLAQADKLDKQPKREEAHCV